MPRKPEPRGKIGLFYDEISYGRNHALNLERNVIALQKLAPQLSKKAGLTTQDVAAIKTVFTKLGKLQDWMYSQSEKSPLTAEDIK